MSLYFWQVRILRGNINQSIQMSLIWRSLIWISQLLYGHPFNVYKQSVTKQTSHQFHWTFETWNFGEKYRRRWRIFSVRPLLQPSNALIFFRAGDSSLKANSNVNYLRRKRNQNVERRFRLICIGGLISLNAMKCIRSTLV